jgi:hypothetical protein
MYAAAAILTVMSLLLLIEGLQGLVGHNKNPSQGVKWLGAGLTAAAALGMFYAIGFIGRMGVRTNGGGIVRNWLRSHHLGWHQIQGFAFGDQIENLSVRQMLASPYLQPYVILNDGHHRVLSGLQINRVGRAAQRARVKGILEELDRLRATAIAGEEPPHEV